MDSTDIDDDALVRFPVLGTDWSNQELADLFRVKQLLERAGVVLSVDRGVTDENDPWFVFCNGDDEVFVHVCRLGRLYLLDSPSLEAPLTGPSFDALIQMFVQRTAASQLPSNVVALRPRNGLYMHPAIMLTALIWSIYIAADDLVGLAQAEELHEHPEPAEMLELHALHEAVTLDEALRLLQQLDTEIAAEARPLLAPLGEGPGARGGTDATGYHPGGPQGMAMAASAVAVSIAVVALSQGLLTMAPEAEPGAGPLPLSTLPGLVLVEAAAPLVYTAAATPPVDPASPPEPEFAVAPAEPASIAIAAVVQVVANLRLPKISTKIAQDEPDLVLAAAMDTPPPQLMLSTPEGPVRDGGAVVVVASAGEAAKAIVTNFDLSSLLADFKPLINYTIGELNVLASVDPTMIFDGDGGAEGDIFGGGAAPVLAAFTPEALAFVGFLMGKTQTVEIVSFANEIVVIDTSARDGYDDISFALSWSFEDGSIISTIGHMRDFVDFGLA